MEDNAARMLLQLSKIVSNEISTDSGCITKGCSPRVRDELLQNSKQVSIPVPKSIEIRKRDWEDSFNAPTSRNSLESNGIPHVVVASNPTFIPNLSSQVSPSILSKNTSFESIGSKSEKNRFRTVSLASEDMMSEDRELSPLLDPLSSPLTSKDVKSYSFPFQDSPQLFSRHVSRLGKHSFLLDKTELQKEAIRRVLAEGGPGAKCLSEALAASSAAAAVITPVPEQSRPVLSFPTPNYNKINSTASKTIAGISSVIQDAGEDRKGPLPLNLPPLLMNPKKTAGKPTVGVAASLAKVTKPIMPLATKSPALTRKAALKKNQPVHGPRATKKKITPKKQQRQRHTGKKFSWKAYPGKFECKRRRSRHSFIFFYFYCISSASLLIRSFLHDLLLIRPPMISRTGRIFD